MAKFKFLVLVISIFFVIQSCSLPHYMMENKAQTTGLDFTKGKWLINDIDCPGNVYQQLFQESTKDFGLFLADRLYPVYNVKGIILPQKIKFNPSKNDIKEMKKGCVGFDYFINIRAGKLKEEIGSIDLTPHHLNTSKTNQSEVFIEIYDLNLSEIIYSQKVIGTSSAVKDNQDVHFSRASSGLIMGAYRKLINDISSKSIK
ncbi:hypothetical protein OX283_000350 [Flavobacterium sp. SUN052]|uniref:hypothetical protein n=1 Tax=Flavobacterium sp. SUN052 TaxID=3002441 RepID=UPI00237D91D7|nr:hypothetical protein [Flavobacterium sp. SUN052]MEC4003092.1 hypothetical protein [Flavobacterium sp. SUN052]